MYVTLPSNQAPDTAQTGLTGKPTKTAEIRARAGASIFFEGDRVENLYQVREGVLRLTRLLEDGRRQVIAFGYPGDIVGFPTDGLHHTDCDVLVSASLQPFRRSVLEDGGGDPDLHRALLQAALREIGAMQDHFMMLGCQSAVEKVASFLCVLSERVGEDLGPFRTLDLPMSRADVADFLGLTTETVSRTLSQLRKKNIIAIDNVHTVTLLRPEQLLDLSQRTGHLRGWAHRPGRET